jgi:hypothetical protein
MAALTLSQRLILRSIANANRLMDPPPDGPENPGYIVGWDKATGSPIVKRNGARIVVRSTRSAGVGKGRAVAVSAYQ